MTVPGSPVRKSRKSGDCPRKSPEVHSAADGKKLAERKRDAPPVFDGLIAAAGRLFMCTTDGRVVCFGGAR